MKKLIFLLAVISSYSSFAAKVTLNDLISKIDHKEVEIGLTHPKPFIKEISLRLDDDMEYKEGDIDIELRVSTDNLKEFSLKRRLYANQKERKEIIQKISLGDKLKQIINYYISLNLSRKKYQLLKGLNTLYQDRVRVYRKLVRKGLADASDYLKAIEKLDLNQVKIKQQLTQVESTVAAINIMLNTDYKITDFAKNEKLLSSTYIDRKLKESAKDIEALSVKLSKYNAKRLELERNLEIEEDNKILDYIGIGLNQRQLPGTTEYEDAGVDDQRLSIKIGLNVPFLDSNMQRADNTIDSFLKKRKARVDYAESQASMTGLRGNLEAIVSGVKKLETSKSIKEAKRYINIYRKRKGTSPLKLLSINEFLINADIQLNEYKSEMYVKFYEYMYEIGKLKFENGLLVIKS